MSQIPWLEGSSTLFPHPSHALSDPDGLLAAGGDLSPKQLLHAYKNGIFPWYDETQPILWWSPNPRLIIRPRDLHISKSLKKTLRQTPFTISSDHSFTEVMEACAAPRGNQPGTWITEEMHEAYLRLHVLGHAHSVEIWRDKQLIGGLYGVAIGQVFFGESMFSRQDNASKIAFSCLLKTLGNCGYELIDCQVHSEHLESLGATMVERGQFLQMLVRYTQKENHPWPHPQDWVLALKQLGRSSGKN